MYALSYESCHHKKCEIIFSIQSAEITFVYTIGCISIKKIN